MEKKSIFSEVDTDEKQARVYRLLQRAAKASGYKDVGQAMHAAHLLAANRDMALESEKYRALLRLAHLTCSGSIEELLQRAAGSIEDAHRYRTLQNAVNVSWTFLLVDDSLQGMGMRHMVVYKGNMSTPEGMDEILDAIQRGEIPDFD